ncbi:MAG: hypothetical protein ACLTL2_00200 [Blautia sp.]|uniref:hypothetical protein n=1 Tax=Blautia sp. TaxID=1955243 RepID=UPI00204B6113|nr:MAG TPA: hypothetical protein [Caudoviricetes sp.]
MKKLTSFTHLKTGEGDRIAYTFSEVDEKGNLVSQQNKGNFIVVDEMLQGHVQAIMDYIKTNRLAE